jgi:hypothetical protein
MKAEVCGSFSMAYVMVNNDEPILDAALAVISTARAVIQSSGNHLTSGVWLDS